MRASTPTLPGNLPKVRVKPWTLAHLPKCVLHDNLDSILGIHVSRISVEARRIVARVHRHHMNIWALHREGAGDRIQSRFTRVVRLVREDVISSSLLWKETPYNEMIAFKFSLRVTRRADTSKA